MKNCSKKLGLLTCIIILSSCGSMIRKKNSNRHAWFSNIADKNKDISVAQTSPVDQSTPAVEIEETQEDVNTNYLSDVIPNAKIFLKDVSDKKVNFWVKYFTGKSRARFQRFLNNGAKYRDVIQHILKENGLPEELFFVGLIESGYYLGAHSRASAVGPWQFIRSTGKAYGLKVNKFVDERRSLHKSTQAAAYYFKDLYNIFGSWELALAAYNAGENGVIRRIRKGNTRDYYELSRKGILPKETRHYVPKVRAAIHIVKNANKYGFHLPRVEDPYKDSKLVTVKRSYKLRDVAKTVGVDMSELKRLNPDLIGHYTPSYRKGYQMRVPNNDFSISHLRKIRSHRNVASNNTTNTEIHVVRRGENLSTIARRYRTSLSKLLRLNGLKLKSRIYVGQKIKVSGKARAVARAKDKSSPTFTYRVRSGDSLWTIANMFDTKISEIKEANNLKSSKLYAGQKIRIKGWEKYRYKVRRGDNLTRISKKFNTESDHIIAFNKLKNSRIYPGQTLVIAKQN